MFLQHCFSAKKPTKRKNKRKEKNDPPYFGRPGNLFYT